MAIVKSDAYGHGILRTARTLAKNGVRWFGVATTAEGLQLREGGIEERILVLTAPPAEHLNVLSEHELEVTVSSPEIADAILECTTHVFRVHVKVDTGMGRIGIAPRASPADRNPSRPGPERGNRRPVDSPRHSLQ